MCVKRPNATGTNHRNSHVLSPSCAGTRAILPSSAVGELDRRPLRIVVAIRKQCEQHNVMCNIVLPQPLVENSLFLDTWKRTKCANRPFVVRSHQKLKTVQLKHVKRE